MKNLAFRQVHLDFHTSGEINPICERFSKEQFQEMLKLGDVNSITVFAKCHHGYAYHPTKISVMHPGLNFDLLGMMIEAAQELRIEAPIYFSAGFDELMAFKHPEWLQRSKNREIDFLRAGYHGLCMNSPYLDYLTAHIVEVIKAYSTQEIFLDIVGISPCVCNNCIKSMQELGLNPQNDEEVLEFAQKTYIKYTDSINNAIKEICPEMRIFHNGGHIRKGRRDLAFKNTHFELESLPTGGWGYDHFPISARYVQNLGLEYLGMTGKFNTTWGEFGGFKHPNALWYETSLSIANGAKCSIGDQLHPNGLMDFATYSIIGKVYRELAKKEEWCNNVSNIADVAILSVESVKDFSVDNPYCRTYKSDIGAARMLLEEHYLFDVIDKEQDFSKYILLILPDFVRIDSSLSAKLQEYTQNGGKLLLTYESGLSMDREQFAIDVGAVYEGKSQFNPEYIRPDFQLDIFENTAFVMYSNGQIIRPTTGTVIASREEPYFNRAAFEFCSHQHTPNKQQYAGAAMVKGQNTIYIGYKVFEDYATKAGLILKELVRYALNELLGEKKTLYTNLPKQGIATLMYQESKNRYINHLLFATPTKRGECIEVIEDIIPLQNVSVKLKISKKITKVYLAPQMEEIKFSQIDDSIEFCVEKIECHQMVVLE